jgi:hypothetical protein
MKLAASRRILPAGLLALVFVLLALLAPAVTRAGGAPVLAFNTTAYDFGTLAPNSTASQTFTLTNSGGKGTGRLTLALSGSAAFSITAETCTSLGPRKSCSVTVTYAPTAAGASDSATLSATSRKCDRLPHRRECAQERFPASLRIVWGDLRRPRDRSLVDVQWLPRHRSGRFRGQTRRVR